MATLRLVYSDSFVAALFFWKVLVALWGGTFCVRLAYVPKLYKIWCYDMYEYDICVYYILCNMVLLYLLPFLLVCL